MAGLMQGIMLKGLGHDVHILEQALSSFREKEAAGITAGPYVKAFFEEYDTSIAPWSSLAPDAKVLDKASKVRAYRERIIRNTSWEVLYYRMRAVFDGFESEYCPKPPVVDLNKKGKAFFDCGKRITGVLETDTTVTV